MIIGDNVKKIIFLAFSILVGIMVYSKNGEIIIPSESIRMRIIANSNDIKDLYEKKKLKEEVEEELYQIIKGADSIGDVRLLLENNMNKINNFIASKTNDFEVKYGLNYFPKKEYKGVIYPEGNYESLVITLGKGMGDNWWCVLYPPLCLISDNTTTSDVEYRSFVYDMIKN